jgi:hypothetical protein
LIVAANPSYYKKHIKAEPTGEISMRRFALVPLLALPLAAVSIAAHQQPGAEPKAKTPAAPATQAPAQPAGRPIAALAFLQGAWRGEVDKSPCEETWSEPLGGHILGMFRWMDPDYNPGMLEILTISEEGDAVMLRLRHFDARLKGWDSEAEAPMTLKLAETAPNKAVFRAVETEKHVASVTYDATTPGHLKIEVAFPSEERDVLAFDLKKVPAK